MAVICERFDQLGFGEPNATYRLGILGGTFDPIHFGHLACAEQVREAFSLDAVIFVPTASPVFKREQQLAPATERLTMCRLATRSNPHFDVSSLEIDRGGDTYTIDTLQQLRAYYPPNVQLYFIAGADAISTISNWKDYQEFGHLAQFIGVARPGYSITSAQAVGASAQAAAASAQVGASAQAGAALADRKGCSFEVSYVEVTALAISSSDLRQRIGNGKSVRYLVPEEVGDYIHENRLYRYE